MAQTLQVPRDATTWKEPKRIRFKLGEGDEEWLSQEAIAFNELGYQLALLPSAVPKIEGKAFLDVVRVSRLPFKSRINGHFKFPRFDMKRIEGKIRRPEDVLAKGLFGIEAFEKEQQAFLKLKSSFLRHGTHRNKFVAVFGGKVVGVDKDIKKLAKRVYDKHGYVPIYIGKVQKENRVAELPSHER